MNALPYATSAVPRLDGGQRIRAADGYEDAGFNSWHQPTYYAVKFGLIGALLWLLLA